MHNFKCHQNVVNNEAFGKESTLRKNNLEPVGKDFGNDFINNVA